MRVLTGTYANGISLDGSTDDPFTVASTGSIASSYGGTALYLGRVFVNFGMYWHVTNYGRIAAEGTRSVGVGFEDGGRLVNGASTDTAAYISGGYRAISLPDGVGAVLNYGTIATTSAHSVGVYLASGGQVENFGLIRSLGTQIEIGAPNGTVTNYGTIGQTGAGTGIALLKGGTVINGSSAVKTALIAGGIEVPGGSGTVTNGGSVAGFQAIFLDAGGTVANSGQVVGAETGVSIYGAGTVVNHGTIRGDGPADNGDAAGVIFNGTFGVDFVSNLGAGYITGNRFGIYASAGTATVVNTARIGNGIVLQGDGNVTNGRHGSTGGRIVGTTLAVYIRGTGTVANYGTMSASNSGEGVGLGGGLVKNFGLIQGQAGVAAGVAAVATIANYGTIRGISSSAGYAVALGPGSLLTNSAGGYIGAAYGVGVLNGNPGTVANSGTIADGMFLQAGGKVVNGNSGLTGGLITEIESPALSGVIGEEAIDVSGATGTVINYGTVAADNGTAIRLQAGGTVRNSQHSALIFGAVTGASIGAAGAVVNRGTILASGDTGIGLSLKNSFNHTVTNSGTITGAGGTAVVFGAGNDRLIVANGAKFNGVVIGGGGTNEIDFDRTGMVALAPEYLGFSIVRLGNGAPDRLTVTAAAFTGLVDNTVTIDGGDSGNMIAAALPAIDRLVLNGGVGADSFRLSPQTLANALVSGGLGADTLSLTNAGTVVVSGLSGVERLMLSDAGPNMLKLTSANFASVTARTITVTGGNAGNMITASLPAADKLVLSGGAGADVFGLSRASLAVAKISGGRGNDRLTVTDAGTVSAGKVSGVERYRLGNGAVNKLTLTNANFIGVTGAVITVVGGNAGNRISEAGVAEADRVTMEGGAGADTLIAGRHASMTGGAGADLFVFETPGTAASPDRNTITDFVHASDKLAVSNAGFHLGEAKASAVPQRLPAGLLSAKTNGTFDKPGQRFAYNSTTGALYFDADGSGVSHARELVATLTNHPPSIAGDLFFVS